MIVVPITKLAFTNCKQPTVCKFLSLSFWIEYRIQEQMVLWQVPSVLNVDFLMVTTIICHTKLTEASKLPISIVCIYKVLYENIRRESLSYSLKNNRPKCLA